MAKTPLGHKITASQLKEFIKQEKLGPEWGAKWMPNQEGIMQLTDPRTDNDLTEFSTDNHLAHLHPNTSKTFVILYNYKKAGDTKFRSGYAELRAKAPVDGADQAEAEKWGIQFPTQWNTVIEKNTMWFYNGNYDTFKIFF